MSERVLAIIPARGGSKGMRRKNLRLLNGRPLVYYVLHTALNARRITNVVFTSEDEDILAYGAQFGILTQCRPPALAEDHVPLTPVVWDALEWAVQEHGPYSVVVRLQPTCPLLRPETLRRAGFSQVYRSGYGQSYSPVLRNTALFDNTYFQVSLYVEARK